MTYLRSSRLHRPLALLALTLPLACGGSGAVTPTPHHDAGSGMTAPPPADGGVGKDVSSGTDTGGQPDAPITVGTGFAQFCNNWLNQQAMLASSCLGGPLAAWTVQYTASFECAAIEAQVNAGTVVFDGTAGAACLDATTTMSCAAVAQACLGSSYPGGSGFGCEDAATAAACNNVIKGTLGVNAVCHAGDVCAPGTACVFADDFGGPGPCGTCQALLPAGAPCTIESVCVAGYSCQMGGAPEAGSSSTCTTIPQFPPVTLAGMGESCSENPCGAKLICSMQTSLCVAAVPEAGSCTPGDFECEPLTACSGATHKCTQFPGLGGACGSGPGEDATECLGATDCATTEANPYMGTCVNSTVTPPSCSDAG